MRSRLRTLHEDREVTRLGEAVFRTNALDPQAMAHTIKVLRRFHKATQQYAVEQVRIVATSALREARNSQAFRQWADAATGWKLEVISGVEEGRLIHLGVMQNGPPAARRVLLVDLGGGSCELTLSINGQIRDVYSLPLGAVRLTREFVRRDPPKKKELARLRDFIVEELSRYQRQLAARDMQVAIATSGTAAALSAMWDARQKGHPRSVPTPAIARMAEELAGLTQQQRAAVPGIGPRRAEIIIAGAVVFAELFTRLGFPSFRYSPLGLRDGLLAQMAADYGQSNRLRQQIQSERHNALRAAARHYRVDLKHAERVSQAAQQLFTALNKLHALPAEYREWLHAAAILYEVGAYVNRTGRYRHAYYIIAHSDLFGYTVQQRTLIAAIARYMGKSRPAATDPILARLRPSERRRLPKAVALLRMAAALDQGRRGAVEGVSARVHDGQVALRIVPRRTSADLELWAIEKEADYFRDVFGRELVATAS